MSEFTYGIDKVHLVNDKLIEEINRLEKQNSDLVEMLKMVVMDLEERGCAYGDIYTMSKQLIQQATTIK